MRIHIYAILMLASLTGCNSRDTGDRGAAGDTANIRLLTLDPGHFHAALIQKTTYPGVDSVVHVYAPPGSDLDLHMARVNAFNTRVEAPTNWNEVVYKGEDYLDRMLKDKRGNVVVLAGNNLKKTDYIRQCVTRGFHVLADKPMAINAQGFLLLKESFAEAERNKLLLYDIMTERYEITTMLQKEFSLLPAVFGQLEKGTADRPAVTKESVHHFYKYVSGDVLTRPSWFFDVKQEGEGIVDVTTHLVDLVQWECFPDQAIDYQKDVNILSARRWPTTLSLSEFQTITKTDSFPPFLQENVKDSVLSVYSNGEINYLLKDVHARVSVTWKYKADVGTGDTHFSIMRGTRCNLIIRQGTEQKFKPTLYIEPVEGTTLTAEILNAAVQSVASKFPGVSVRPVGSGWQVVIPDHYNEGHEAHFARVAEKFLSYVRTGSVPEWEVPNMIAKYYTTTKALELATSGSR